MPVCRVIFRLDFKRPNFEFIEHPGQIMRMLSSGKEKFWSKLSEATQTHTITAAFTSEDKNLHRQLTVEPNSVNGSVDVKDGIEFAKFLEHDSFAYMEKLVSMLNTEYRFGDLSRVGLRTFYFSKLGAAKDDVKNSFAKLFNSEIVSMSSKTLGRIKDFGIAFDGEAEDKLRYRHRIGPYDADEADKYFHEDVVEQFQKNLNFDFICENDLFEQNVLLGDITFGKWCVPVLKKMTDVVSSTESTLKKAMKVAP